jgi:hypothetical protein
MVEGRGVEWVEVNKGLAGGLSGTHRVEVGFAGKLLDGSVLEDEDDGPDEVGQEASPENDDEDGKVLPEVETMVSEQLGLGEVADGFAGFEAEGKEGAHNAGEDGEGDSFAEGEVSLPGFGLLFGGHFTFFGKSCGSVHGDGDETKNYAVENDLDRRFRGG